MSYIFDVHKKQKLNSEERRRLLAPYETLKRLGYREGAAFADIGCGTGLFTFPAAEIGGSSAAIYAVDISPEMLEDVRLGAEERGADNIETVLSEPYDFKLQNGTADFVLICTVLHEIGDKARFIQEAKRICTAGGKIAVIDFGDKDTGFGPDMSRRVRREDALGLLTESGFHETEAFDIGETFYAVTGIA
jgi:ubiquinone/menaquinone biosynthesis C-methylase UbiE